MMSLHTSLTVKQNTSAPQKCSVPSCPNLIWIKLEMQTIFRSGRWEGIFYVRIMDNSRLSLTDNYATKDPASLIDGKNEKIHPRILFHVFMGLHLVLSGVFFPYRRHDVTSP